MIPFFNWYRPYASGLPITGIAESVRSTRSFSSAYPSFVRTLLRYFDIPPTFLEMDISLSFRTIMKFFLIWAALFNASYAIPPVRAPSPMTEITE